MNKIISLLFLLFLSGCSLLSPQPEVIIREVEVPVIIYADVVPAKVDPMERLPIYDLTDESTEDEVSIAITESIVILESYRRELEEAIRPFEEGSDDRNLNVSRIIRRQIDGLDSAINTLSTPLRKIEEEDNEE